MGEPVRTDAPPRPERRRHARAAFTPLRRPRLLLPLGRYDVVDASLGGLRVLHNALIRPAVGDPITGTLEWVNGEPPLRIDGTIVRVGRTDFAMACAPGAIPLGYLPWASPS